MLTKKNPWTPEDLNPVNFLEKESKQVHGNGNHNKEVISEVATTKYGVYSLDSTVFLLFLEKDAGFYKTAQPVLHPPTQDLETIHNNNSEYLLKASWPK